MQPGLIMTEPAGAGAAFSNACTALRALPLGLAPDSVADTSARLVCGDFEAVRALLRDAPPTPALPLVAARYHAWSGDLHTVLAVFDTIRASLSLVDLLEPASRLATWSELERTATDAGDPILASRLVARARAETGARADQTEPSPAGIILDIAHDLLGVEADAPRGRIRLRPRIGAHSAIRLRGLRFADGSIAMDAHRDGDSIALTVEQESGALPFTLILEPLVEAAVSAFVDDQPADLRVQPHPLGVTVPVQLVLDDIRRLIVRTR